MIDIQSAAAENRPGKKKIEDRWIEEETTGQKYNGLLHRATIISIKSGQSVIERVRRFMMDYINVRPKADV